MNGFSIGTIFRDNCNTLVIVSGSTVFDLGKLLCPQRNHLFESPPFRLNSITIPVNRRMASIGQQIAVQSFGLPQSLQIASHPRKEIHDASRVG